MREPVVLGIIERDEENTRVAYLEEVVSLSGEVAAAVPPASRGQVMRLAAKCEQSTCKHFTGMTCSLATKIVELLDPVVDVPPPCMVRSSCRWYVEQGKAACFRCPQVVTEISPDGSTSRVMKALAG